MQNHLTKESEDVRAVRLAKLLLVLADWFRKWTDVFPTHEVTKLQMMAYAEALDDLSPEALQIGCREASRTAEQFPKPGHIRRSFEENRPHEQFLGPKLDWSPEVEREWRERYYKERNRNFLVDATVNSEAEKFLPPSKSLEEQKEEMRKRGWLQ